VTGVGRASAFLDLGPAPTAVGTTATLDIDGAKPDPWAPTPGRPRPAHSAARRPRWRRRLLLGVVVGLLAGGLGYLVGNEVQATTQFDQARHALEVREGHIGLVLAQLTSVESDLRHVDGQIGSDAATLSSDAAQLQSLQGQLSTTRADVARQTSDIADLQTCLSGVEEALNALSVGDSSVALNSLESVTASCQHAVAVDG
jgi:hypothetical protein